MKKLTKYTFALNTLICLLGVCIIIFTVFILGWKPCPMCLLQQLCIVCILMFSILGGIKKEPQSFSLAIHAVIIAIILLGVYIATKQVYIQYFPSTSTATPGSCGGIDNPFLLDATKSITGTVESCTDIAEKISGVSLAVYSLIFFLGLLVFNCLSLLIKIFKK